ncbi:MAG TPA: hypothetical protein QGF02_00960 [Candidatus Babeliales bacterium]|nr:hypothetical protein [Candidatus Babeliales bacterium]
MKKQFLMLALSGALMASGAQASIVSSFAQAGKTATVATANFTLNNKKLVGTAIVSTAAGAYLMYVGQKLKKRVCNYLYQEDKYKAALKAAALEQAINKAKKLDKIAEEKGAFIDHMKTACDLVWVAAKIQKRSVQIGDLGWAYKLLDETAHKRGCTILEVVYPTS